MGWTYQIVWIKFLHFHNSTSEREVSFFRAPPGDRLARGESIGLYEQMIHHLKVVTWRPSRLIRCFLEFLHEDKIRMLSWKVSSLQGLNPSFGRWPLPSSIWAHLQFFMLTLGMIISWMWSEDNNQSEFISLTSVWHSKLVIILFFQAPVRAQDIHPSLRT